MQRLGFSAAIWAIFAFVWVLTTGLAVAALYASDIVAYWFVLLALTVSSMQLAVAWTNSTGRWNFFTRWVLRMHRRALTRR